MLSIFTTRVGYSALRRSAFHQVTTHSLRQRRHFLVHGWLIDPESPEYPAVSRVKDDDSAMKMIVEAGVLTRGPLAGNGVDDNGGARVLARLGQVIQV
jgi:hypothetical protein